VLEPVPTAGMKGGDVVRLVELVRSRIAEAEADMRRERAAEGWEPATSAAAGPAAPAGDARGAPETHPK